MKKVILPIGIIGGLLVAIIALWFLLPEWVSPHYSNSSDLSLPVHGDISQTANVESELCDAIKNFEDGTENLALIGTFQEGDTMRFTFSFDRTTTGYAQLWTNITNNELTGVAELVVSIPDAIIRRISYNYGYIRT